jgi:Zn ribbon nucleic-acid-binding protein
MKEFNRKFCPNCGSDNIKWAIPQNWSLWECFNCGYTGALIIEDGEMAQEIKEKYEKKKGHSKE